jgi:hypothetical protein
MVKFLFAPLVLVIVNTCAFAASSTMPTELLGTWCYYSDDDKGTTYYLQNDPKAPKAGTPCKEGSDAEWMVIDKDGYHSAEDG